jgi:hypothetical protein
MTPPQLHNPLPSPLLLLSLPTKHGSRRLSNCHQYRAERDLHCNRLAAIGQQCTNRHRNIPGWGDDPGNGNCERERGSNVEYELIAGGDAVDYGCLRRRHQGQQLSV